MTKIVLAKILLTVAAIQYGVIPLFADLATTHVFHPDWHPHARFHMVWLLGFGLSLSMLVVGLVWLPSQQSSENLRGAAILGFLPLLGFFAAAITMPSYDGSLTAVEGRSLRFGIEGNLLSFSIAATLQAIAAFIVFARK